MTGRKVAALSLKRKIELIEAVEANPSRKKKDIAADFGVAANTLSSVLKEKDKYRRLLSAGDFSGGSLRARTAKHAHVEEELLKWYRQARASNLRVTGRLLGAKAEEVARDFGEQWKCNEGWLCRFKKRHGISSRKTYDTSDIGSRLRRAVRTKRSKPDFFNPSESHVVRRRNVENDARKKGKRGRPRGAISKPKPEAEKPKEKEAPKPVEEDVYANIPPERSFQYSIVLAELNRKMGTQNFKPT